MKVHVTILDIVYRKLFHAPGPTTYKTLVSAKSTGVPPLVSRNIEGLKPAHGLTGNKGNAVHAEAPAKIFKKNSSKSAFIQIPELQQHLGNQYTQYIKENFDWVVISLANYLRPRQNHHRLLQAVRAIPDSTNLMVLGAGLQNSVQIESLEKETVELTDVINQRAKVFGVRGDATSRWLAENGFENAKVLGCPSLYVYPQQIRNFGENYAKSDRLLTAGHLSKSKLTIEQHRRGNISSSIFQDVKADYVFQDEPFSFEGLLHENIYNEATGQFSASEINSYLSDISQTKIDFGKYYYFHDVSAWRQMSSNYDLYIGDRFHAGVVAMQAGIPAVFIVSDQRVSELVDFFQLPNLTFQDLSSAESIESAITSVMSRKNIDNVIRTFDSRFANFKDTMNSVGIELCVE